jgi:transketolase
LGCSLRPVQGKVPQGSYVPHPQEANELERRFAQKLPEGWRSILPQYTPADPAKATRQFSETAINKIAEALPEFVGGSADLNPSTLTYLKCSKAFDKKNRDGRNIHFGVREHGMAAICNGNLL